MNCMQIAFQPGNWPDTIAISLNDFRANKFPLCQTNARSHTHMDRHTHTHAHVGRHEVWIHVRCTLQNRNRL